MNFLDQFEKPIVGLAPMDGVSDYAFRFITKKYGNPDLIFTEFTNVMGMCIAGDNIMHTFFYDKSQRPIIGQIYGNSPEYFYHATKIICELGFDGVDINMGCPAKNVASSGAGAGLIRTPELAREIIRQVKRGVADWVEDGKLTGLSKRSLQGLITMKEKMQIDQVDRKTIPVSVKTRIGFDQPETERWIENLSKENPEWITLHGRTLKQMYTGKADWSEIKKAVNVTDIPIIANGDITSKNDLNEVIELTGARGVLVGRASFGNPWIFKNLKGEEFSPTLEEKIKVMIEHTEKFIEIYSEPKLFFQMRKHYGWYMKGFEGAVDMRRKLMTTTSLDDLKVILNQ